MKKLLFITFILISNLGFAQIIWPGDTAPCNTTLQACVNGSADNETIEIRTNDVIDETITSSTATSFIAGNGFKPIFAANRHIEVTKFNNSDTAMTVSGLTFSSGRISYNVSGLEGVTTTLNISNNQILDNNFATESIRILNFSNQNMELNIDFNHLIYHASGNNLNRNGAISITNGSTNVGASTTGSISGRIYNNRIHVNGDLSAGIGFYEFSGSSSDLNVSSNTIIGGAKAAMYIEKPAGSIGESRLDFAHNALYNNQTDTSFNGLKALVSDGLVNMNVINNSIVSANEGVSFQQITGGEFDINLYNNLIISTQTPVVINTPTNADTNINVNISNDNNLFFNNPFSDPDFITGPAHLTTNPQIKGSFNARLKPGSPAIEAGDGLALFFVADAPLIDADGLLRIKNGNPGSGGVAVDIGAYEAGDINVIDINYGNGGGNTNNIGSTSINTQAFAKLHVTQNWNPNGLPTGGVYNDSYIGVWRSGSVWTIFNQGGGSDFMTSNAAFNVWSPAPSSNDFVHQKTSAGGFWTTIDRSAMNNNPELILSVTQLFGVYNNNPIGAYYDLVLNQWQIENKNFEEMPLNAEFNVHYQAPSANAFVHTVQETNTNDSGGLSFINHPLLNNSSCANFQVTQVGFTTNPHPIGVYYVNTTSSWAIFNQNNTGLSIGAKFHIIVSAEQIADCSDLIFGNGFE